MIEQCLLGYNVTVFAYGHTGAGKSFTIMGESKKGVEGVLHNSCDLLMRRLAAKKEWVLTCQFVEIYNEQFRDLLALDCSSAVRIVEDKKGCMALQGAREVTVSEGSEAFSIEEVLSQGMRNRSVGGTQANAQSSRSHSIFTFSIQFKSDEGRLCKSKLNIIDLAGSERTGETNA